MFINLVIPTQIKNHKYKWKWKWKLYLKIKIKENSKIKKGKRKIKWTLKLNYPKKQDPYDPLFLSHILDKQAPPPFKWF